MLLAQVVEASASAITSIPWYGWVGIVAIVGGTVSGVVKMMIDHRERMALIQQGINPDARTNPAKPPIGEL